MTGVERRDDEQLRFENVCVLSAVEALYGEVTPAMQAITLDADSATREVYVHIAASETLPEEILHDIATELNLLLGAEGGDAIVDQWVGEDRSLDWPHRSARPVYAARIDRPD